MRLAVQEIKHDNKVAAGWLLYCNERRSEYERIREELIHSGSSAMSNAPGRSEVTDNTGKRAIKLADLQKTEQWLELIDHVESILPMKLAIFLKWRRYYRDRAGSNGWVAPVQRKFAEELAETLGKKPEDVWVESRQTFWGWWTLIVNATTHLAAKRNLL